MRNVKYGAFVDFMPPAYDQDGLIGGHARARNVQKQALETLDHEYYLIHKDGFIETISDAKFL